jgi:uncharacterized repeat protein (TIGR01451 family)
VPADTPEGSYEIEYQVCEDLNPTNCDTATITIEVKGDEETGTPGIGLTKVADPERFSEAGEVITYTITVSNTGDVSLTKVRVTDPLVAFDTTISELAPGEDESFTVEYSITEEDLDAGEVLNVARATSVTLDDEVVEAQGNATVVLDDTEETGCGGFDWSAGTLFTTILAFLAMLFSSLFGGGAIRPPKI